MTPAFGFRQRCGNINWNAVSSIDLDDVVESVKITDLQDVLDNITFSSFMVHDLRNCSYDTTMKLIQVFQFIVEYLLHCQESQNAVIHKVHKRNVELKSTNQQLTQQTAALREDRRIYQRQLSVLKSTVGVLQPQPPRAVLEAFVGAEDKKKGIDASELQSIMDSVLRHEKESREMLRMLLEDQRNSFMKELELSHAAIVATGADAGVRSTAGGQNRNEKTTTISATADANNAEMLGGFATQFDDILKQQRKQYEDIKQLSADNLKESLRLEKVKMDMEAKSKQLTTQEQEIFNREEDLKERIHEWERRRKQDADRMKAKEYLTSVDSLVSLRPPTKEKAVILRAQSRSLSAKGIRHRILHALMWQLGKSFRRWLDITIDRREKEQYAEAARLRTAAVASHQRHEQELLDLLNGEKERSVAEQAKSNSMALLAEQERARLHEAVQQAEETVLIQSNHIVRLQEQLQALQASTGIAVDTSDTAVMTSIEYVPKPKSTPTTPFPPRYINTTSTGTSTSNPPSPHPSSHIQRFSFTAPLNASGSGMTPVPSNSNLPSAALSAVDPALMAKIHAKLGDGSSLDDAMAFAHQRIAAATRSKRPTATDAAGAQLATEIYERLKSAPFRQVQQN